MLSDISPEQVAVLMPLIAKFNYDIAVEKRIRRIVRDEIAKVFTIEGEHRDSGERRSGAPNVAV